MHTNPAPLPKEEQKIELPRKRVQGKQVPEIGDIVAVYYKKYRSEGVSNEKVEGVVSSCLFDSYFEVALTKEGDIASKWFNLYDIEELEFL